MGFFPPTVKKGILAAVMMTFIGIPAFADEGASGRIYMLISTHKDNEIAQVPLPFEGDVLKDQHSYVRHPSAIHPASTAASPLPARTVNFDGETLAFQGNVMKDDDLPASLPVAKTNSDTLAFQEDVVKPVNSYDRKFSIPHVVVSMR